MDAALGLPIQSPPGIRPVTALRPLQSQPQRSPSLRKPQSPRGPGRDARFRRTPPGLPKDGDRTGARASKAKARISPKAVPRSLLPATERRSQEENKLGRARKQSDADKWDVTPDGGSGSRDPRHFTVANVGNNGRIYLRYALPRPARAVRSRVAVWTPRGWRVKGEVGC